MSTSEPIATVQLYLRSNGTYGARVCRDASSVHTDGWATMSACLDHVARLLGDARSRSSRPPCAPEPAPRKSARTSEGL
jgi:hypothetical protein